MRPLGQFALAEGTLIASCCYTPFSGTVAKFRLTPCLGIAHALQPSGVAGSESTHQEAPVFDWPKAALQESSGATSWALCTYELFRSGIFLGSIFCVIFVRFGVRTTMPLPRIDGVSRTRYDPPKGKAQPAQGLSLPSTVSLPTI